MLAVLRILLWSSPAQARFTDDRRESPDA